MGGAREYDEVNFSIMLTTTVCSMKRRARRNHEEMGFTKYLPRTRTA